MAQNFINYFETDSLYNAAKSGLSQPNVSLVKESGNLHYTKHLYGLAASEVGDIILEDSTKLYSVNPDNYNLIDFPLETYTPIGITVIPGSVTPNGLARVFSIKILSRSNPGNGVYISNNYISNTFAWGPGVDDSENYQDITSKSLLNGKEITQYIINNRQTADWSGSSIPYTSSDGHYPIFCFVSRYHTTVTQEGDWYVPSFNELQYTFSYNRSYFKYSFEQIINVAGTNIGLASDFIFNTKTLYIWTSTQHSTYVTRGVLYESTNTSDNYTGYTGGSNQKTNTHLCFPMLQIGVEEV